MIDSAESFYFFRRLQPRPARPSPRRAREVGSGTKAAASSMTRVKFWFTPVPQLHTVAAHAQTFTARVIGITDGDAITVLVERCEMKVRLVEIDAPERSQPWGKRSTQALSDLCLGMERGWKRAVRTVPGLLTGAAPGLSFLASHAPLAATALWALHPTSISLLSMPRLPS